MRDTVGVRTGLALMLADLVAGQWAAPTVHLYTNEVDPGAGASVGDFVEGTFTGVTAKSIGAWGEPYVTADGDLEVAAPTLQWNWSAGAAETVFGVFVLGSGSGTPLLGYGRLDVGKPMGTVLDSLAIVPRLRIGPNGLGAFIQVSD